jgi:adenosylmethionine-8-amino-7-oxononanoate aminotransferase
VPWRLPVAVKGEGIYLELEDGSRIIDGVGGAAVTCIGSGNPKVAKAISNQLQELVCTSSIHLIWSGAPLTMPCLIDVHRCLQCPAL